MNNLAEVNPVFENGCHEDRTISAEAEEFISRHEIQRLQPTESATLGDTERPDWGLWLLCGAATRHDRWEHLRRIPLRPREVQNISVKNIQQALKRCCDVLGALFLLSALFPLLLLVAVLIKFDSIGPVFFRHNRVGKDDRLFTLWKFRSMKTDVLKYEVSPTSVTDARLTRVGRWIRRMSIDEMPQLINVLKGDMSLVGPRPEMPFIVHRYGPVASARLRVKPGITGLWQISPARAFPIHENLQYDFHYISNQNFLLDCAIIARTITAVIHGVGAV
jgi:lipopolysaccharide/colanic/teichoic acid biosynthesis glycosyltransferase